MINTATHELDTFGYTALRHFVDATALANEFDATMQDAFENPAHLNAGAVGNQFRYVPTMCEHTPISVELVVRLAPLATKLLGCTVLPVRAKATTYVGAANWHRDSDLPLRSIAFVAYLEALDDDTGAFRVIPGSHHPTFGDAVQRNLPDLTDLRGVAIATNPGDVIAFDEHLFHSSNGTTPRRQWRVDFVADNGADDELREYFARQYTPGWDGGYDIDRYPSYGTHWNTLNPHWNERLAQLGAHHHAHAEEADIRQTRLNRPITGTIGS